MGVEEMSVPENTSTKKIILIDDDDEFRDMLSRMLERAGYRVRGAQNGKIGVRFFKEDPPDLVITDLFMPEQEGLETIRELIRLDPKIKIMAISGGCTSLGLDFLPFAEALGAVCIMPKPFSRKDILREIRELISEGNAI